MENKFLINANFKAIRCGEFVSASEDAGEFVVDFSDCNLTKGQLEEIANQNKVKVSQKLRIAEYASTLCSELNKLNLPKVGKMTESVQVKEIVEAGFAAGKAEEDIMIEILQAGISFKKAGKLYKQAVIDAGLAASPKELKEEVFGILDDKEFAPESYDEVTKMAAYIEENVKHCDDKQALSYIKRWARANEVTLPKKVRAKRIGKVLGFGGFGAVIMQHLVQNPAITEDELTEFIETQKPDFEEERVKRLATKFHKYAAYHQAVTSGEMPVEAESDDSDEESDAA